MPTTPEPLRQQLHTVADNTQTLADNSSKLAGGPARDAGLIESHQQEWSGRSGRPQAMLGQGHGELLGAGGLIGRFRVDVVSSFGVVSNMLSVNPSARGSAGPARSWAASSYQRRAGSAPPGRRA
jgi:hypothetical protein